MLIIRRHASVLLKNSERDFRGCVAMEKINHETSENKKSADYLDTRYVHCLKEY